MEIEPLAKQLLMRHVESTPPQTDLINLPKTYDHKPMNPELAAFLGGMADAASTYSFLKKGTGQEANAMWSGLGNSPAKTALGVAGASLGMMGIRHLIRKMGGDKLADTLAANQGAYQMGLAANNLRLDRVHSSDDATMNQLRTAVVDPGR